MYEDITDLFFSDARELILEMGNSMAIRLVTRNGIGLHSVLPGLMSYGAKLTLLIPLCVCCNRET